MKKIKINKNLFLEKKAILKLEDTALDRIAGGAGGFTKRADATCCCTGGSCPPTITCPPKGVIMGI